MQCNVKYLFTFRLKRLADWGLGCQLELYRINLRLSRCHVDERGSQNQDFFSWIFSSLHTFFFSLFWRILMSFLQSPSVAIHQAGFRSKSMSPDSSRIMSRRFFSCKVPSHVDGICQIFGYLPWMLSHVEHLETVHNTSILRSSRLD